MRVERGALAHRADQVRVVHEPEPGDAAGRELLEVYNGIAPQPHPDPDDFFTTMVAEKRLVLTLRPDAISGFGW